MNNNGMRDTGLPWMVVEVDDITNGVAAVKDGYGKRRDIPMSPRRAGGPFPRVGETWLLDRTLGHWSFAAVLDARLPVVLGSTDGIPALTNLLTALHDMGLIVNQTTDERIRSTYPHTHPNPEGGSTGPDSLP